MQFEPIPSAPQALSLVLGSSSLHKLKSSLVEIEEENREKIWRHVCSNLPK